MMAMRFNTPLQAPNGRNLSLAEIERNVILHTIRQTRTMTEAANVLGIGRSTLYRKFNEYRAIDEILDNQSTA